MTGGASGIGAAVVERLRRRAIPVVVADVQRPPSGSFVRCDVSDPDACIAAFDEAERLLARLDRLDLVVLSAGVGGGSATPESVALDDYRRLVQTNLDGVVFGIRAATPALRRAGGGSIVVLGSLAALYPAPEHPLYTMTKAGVVGLVRALGPTLGREGITCNVVCPGFTDTPMIDPLRDDFATHGFPLLTPAAVVDAVLLAASTSPGGQVILVQAGHDPTPYRFRGVPGARVGPDGPSVPVPGRAE